MDIYIEEEIAKIDSQIKELEDKKASLQKKQVPEKDEKLLKSKEFLQEFDWNISLYKDFDGACLFLENFNGTNKFPQFVRNFGIDLEIYPGVSMISNPHFVGFRIFCDTRTTAINFLKEYDLKIEFFDMHHYEVTLKMLLDQVREYTEYLQEYNEFKSVVENK